MADRHSYTTSGKALQTQHDTGPRAQAERHQAFLKARYKQITKWVRYGVQPEALVRFTLHDMATNAKLRECTPESILIGLLACAASGLEPGALKGEAYLVPFRNKGVMQATYIPGWKGLVKQVRRSREVVGITANIVRENDLFDIDEGTANTVIHKPLLRGERGDVIGAYAIARTVGGHNEIEWMDRADLDKIRDMATKRGESFAWSDWPDQMARKTPIRRLCKRLPMGADYFLSLALEQATDDGKEQKEVLDIFADDDASTDSGAQNAPQMTEPAFDPSVDLEPS